MCFSIDMLVYQRVESLEMGKKPIEDCSATEPSNNCHKSNTQKNMFDNLVTGTKYIGETLSPVWILEYHMGRPSSLSLLENTQIAEDWKTT